MASQIRKSRGSRGTDINWPYQVILDAEGMHNGYGLHVQCQKAYEWLTEELTKEELEASPFCWGSRFAFKKREHAVMFAKVWAPKRYGYE